MLQHVQDFRRGGFRRKRGDGVQKGRLASGASDWRGFEKAAGSKTLNRFFGGFA